MLRGLMATIWIVHRDPRGRATLARLAGNLGGTVLGAPTDDLFQSRGAPDVVVLGLVGSFEAELEFVHRVGPRLRESAWILSPDESGAAEARRLFDTLACEVLAYPPTPLAMRRCIQSALHRRRADPLSARRSRDRLAARFSHWFADLALPELLRVLDPALARVPLLIRGEPGTGRGLLARYVHAFGGFQEPGGNGAFVQVSCRGATQLGDLLAQIRDGGGAPPLEAPCTVCLEEVQELPAGAQLRLRSWVEFGLPPGALGVPVSRWIATAGDPLLDDAPPLDPNLERTLSGIQVRIPPLRERPAALESFVTQTALRWCYENGQPPRHFSEEALQELGELPWPGNLSELEAVVERTLAETSAEPVRGIDLRFEGLPRSPRATEEPDLDEQELGEPLVAANPSDAAAPAEILPEPEVPEPPAAPSPRPDEEAWRRLVAAVAHEIRNPLVSIRTFSELLPERFDDPEFRERFAQTVGADVRRIEEVVTQLQEMAGREPGERAPVDVAGLLEELLEERRSRIRERHLLVLRELERESPLALGEAAVLRGAFASLLDRALELVPERGDVYLASRHHPAGLRGGPSLRVLLRYTGSGPGAPRRTAPVEGVSPSEASIEFSLAEAAIRSQEGLFTVDASDARESVVVIDLPAPATSS